MGKVPDLTRRVFFLYHRGHRVAQRKVENLSVPFVSSVMKAFTKNAAVF